MKRILTLALAAALVGCAPAGPENGDGSDGWVVVADPANGRTFHCYWWAPRGQGGGTIWCYEPDAGTR